MSDSNKEDEQEWDFPDSLSRVLVAAISQSFNSVLVTDAQPGPFGPTILFSNPAFCAMTGYRPDELVGKTPRILQGPQTCPEVLDELRKCLSAGRFFRGSTVNYRKDGTPYAVEWNISPIRDDSGQITHFLSIQQDITAMVAVQSSRELLSQALDVAQDGIFITDTEGYIEFANQGFEAITGYRSSEVLGHMPSVLNSGKQNEEFYQKLWETLKAGETFRANIVNRHRDGHLIHCEESITAIRNSGGGITHFVSIMKDLTERVMEERELRRQAEYDALTGLLNRRSGELRLEQAYLEARERRGSFVVLMLDIDHFKQVNDTWGHATGDRILEIISRRLRRSVRVTDSVVRWGGEEFVVILPWTDLTIASKKAEDIRERVASSEVPDAGQVTVSIGLACSDQNESLSELLERADAALYRAKDEGRNRVVSLPKEVS